MVMHGVDEGPTLTLPGVDEEPLTFDVDPVKGADDPVVAERTLDFFFPIVFVDRSTCGWQ